MNNYDKRNVSTKSTGSGATKPKLMRQSKSLIKKATSEGAKSIAKSAGKAVAGAATGAVTGGTAKGLGSAVKKAQSKSLNKSTSSGKKVAKKLYKSGTTATGSTKSANTKIGARNAIKKY